MGWTRRRVLRGLSHGLALAAFAPFLLWRAAAPRRARDAGWLREILPDAAAAGSVARAYLAANRDAGKRARDLRAVLLALPDGAAGRAFLAARRRRDFETGALAIVDGWVLAATEAELCVLAHGRFA